MAGDDSRCAGDRRRGGDVERLGAAGPQRDRHLDLALGAAPRRAGPRARRRGRPSPRPASASRPAPPWATSATRGAGVASTLGPQPAAGRRSSPCSPAPPSARTGRRSRDRATTGPPSSASAVRTIVADVAGVADAVQVDAGRAGPLRPAQRPDRDRPRAGAERGDAGQQLRLDLLAAPAPAARAGGAAGSAARRRPPARPRPGPRPRSTNSPSRSRCLRSRSLRTSFSFSFWGLAIIVRSVVGCGLSLLARSFLLLERKSGPSSRPARESGVSVCR